MLTTVTTTPAEHAQTVAQGPILVLLDGSSVAEQALPVAAELARRTGAALRLVHVHTPIAADPIHVEGLPVIDEHMRSLGRQHEQAYLEQVRGRLRSGVAASAALLDGPVATAVAAFASANTATHIVMTTHGRGGLARAWLGSVADALVRVSQVPVLLVRPESGSVPGAFRRILVPLDGSAVAGTILEHAGALARLDTDSEVILLAVVQPIDSAMWIPDMGFATSVVGDDVTAELERHARAYLNGVSRRLEASGVRVRTRVQVATAVSLAILDVARDEQADIIALTTHGRSGIRRLALGSVADKVVRGSHVPILLFRPPRWRNRNPRIQRRTTTSA
jgi:nucleotide-binding universal stress UspA family protein